MCVLHRRTNNVKALINYASHQKQQIGATINLPQQTGNVNIELKIYIPYK
jgi:hypothetical protein